MGYPSVKTSQDGAITLFWHRPKIQDLFHLTIWRHRNIDTTNDVWPLIWQITSNDVGLEYFWQHLQTCDLSVIEKKRRRQVCGYNWLYDNGPRMTTHINTKLATKSFLEALQGVAYLHCLEPLEGIFSPLCELSTLWTPRSAPSSAPPQSPRAPPPTPPWWGESSKHQKN